MLTDTICRAMGLVLSLEPDDVPASSGTSLRTAAGSPQNLSGAR